MRGKANFGQPRRIAFRITPAYAGKRRSLLRKTAERRDHPRVCGEKSDFAVIAFPVLGSPPRMRGKEKKDSITHSKKRITPAYAGKSQVRLCPDSKRKDHPRVCGEKKEGKAEIARTLRITPAYAGKSSYANDNSYLPGDHPRVCGEKPLVIIIGFPILGSPPRMRGKVTGYFGVCIRIRITPAYAGKRRSASYPSHQR